MNVNPLYKPRELEFQLKDCGAEAIVVLENFAAVLQEALPYDRCQARRGRQHGRHARHAERHAGQCRGALRQEDGAALQPAGRDHIQRRACPRRHAAVHARRGRARRHRLPAIYRRHHRRRQGRHAAASQSGRQCAAGGGVERADGGRAAGDRPHHRRHRVAALSHLRAHRVLPVRRAHRRHVHSHSEPTRHQRPDQGTEPLQGELVPGGEHALQRAAQSSRFRQARLEHAEIRGRRRHGGAEGAWRTPG